MARSEQEIEDRSRHVQDRSIRIQRDLTSSELLMTPSTAPHHSTPPVPNGLGEPTNHGAVHCNANEVVRGALCLAFHPTGLELPRMTPISLMLHVYGVHTLQYLHQNAQNQQANLFVSINLE